jgi:hypothetical protein
MIGTPMAPEDTAGTKKMVREQPNDPGRSRHDKEDEHVCPPEPYGQVTPGTTKPSATGNISTEKAVDEMKSQAANTDSMK